MIHKVAIPNAEIEWGFPDGDGGSGLYYWNVKSGNVTVSGNASTIRKARRQVRRALRTARRMGGTP